MFHAHEDYHISSSVLSFGFEEEYYSGNEGPDRRSTLPNAPCTVTIRIDRTTIEDDLTFQLIPRTIPENVDASGPPPTATLRGANASSENMCLHLHNVTEQSLEWRKTAWYPPLVPALTFHEH